MVTKHYPPEAKADAVAPIANDLGMNPKTLRSWIRLADGRRSGPAVLRPDQASPGKRSTTLPL